MTLYVYDSVHLGLLYSSVGNNGPNRFTVNNRNCACFGEKVTSTSEELNECFLLMQATHPTVIIIIFITITMPPCKLLLQPYPCQPHHKLDQGSL